MLQPDDLPDLPQEVRRRLLGAHSDCWSAITVSDGNCHLIVINSAHAKTRLNSSLAHEIAHIILGHEPSMMFMSPSSGMALRTYDEEQEEQANWLAGCLLLPREAIVTIRRTGRSEEDACSDYCVSSAMLRFRLNVTGVESQLRHAQGYTRGRR